MITANPECQPDRGQSLLTYILSMHEVGKAFYAMQAAGLIPFDEPFVHNNMIDTSDPNRLTFTGLDVVAIAGLNRRLYARELQWHGGWIRYPEGSVEARCVAALPNGQFVSSACRLRQFAIDGIAASDIAEELATAELGWLTDQYYSGQPVALNAVQGTALLAELHDGTGLKSRAGWMPRYCAGGPPSA